MGSDSYSFEANLGAVPFQAALDRVTAALGAEGFGVLTEIDVRRTLDEKLGLAFRPYRILGACNPSLAHQALLADPKIGLLLPCNVVVQEFGGTVLVSIADPKAMLAVADNPRVAPIAAEAEHRLRRVAIALDADPGPSAA